MHLVPTYLWESVADQRRSHIAMSAMTSPSNGLSCPIGPSNGGPRVLLADDIPQTKTSGYVGSSIGLFRFEGLLRLYRLVNHNFSITMTRTRLALQRDWRSWGTPESLRVECLTHWAGVTF
ncbi:hypothetical protein LIA77_05922 [Sarocladium implicatum]|nr:hypothetical protein LIA77_05922 [Sarocladium implicatum]